MIRRYMLDTNAVTAAIKLRPYIVQRIEGVAPNSLCVSCVTEGELIFGINRMPSATTLNAVVRRFLAGIEKLPWDSLAAQAYGVLRTEMRRIGKALDNLDMMIASHAIAIDATLVTADRAFLHAPNLRVEDWTQP